MEVVSRLFVEIRGGGGGVWICVWSELQYITGCIFCSIYRPFEGLHGYGCCDFFALPPPLPSHDFTQKKSRARSFAFDITKKIKLQVRINYIITFEKKIQHLQGKAEQLEPCLKAMDLLNSALGLHEDMRSGTKPVPLGMGSGGGGATAGGGASSRRSSGGPPRAGGEQRGPAENLRDFLSTGIGSGGGGSGSGGRGVGGSPLSGREGDGGAGAGASLRLYKLPAVQEACGGFDPKRCIGEGGFGKVRRDERGRG